MSKIQKRRDDRVMANVFDVARYILNKCGTMSTMKLQKLVYYCQAWSLAWDDAPLFDEAIQAWANGPVVPVLFDTHKGRYNVNEKYFSVGNRKGDLDNLTPIQKDTIDSVIEFYGNKSPQWLSDLTHSEDPWKDARRGIPEGERGNSEITLEKMMEYYVSL